MVPKSRLNAHIFLSSFQIFLFLWWILCTVMSVYIVIFYGRPSSTSSSKTSSSSSGDSLKESDDLMTYTNKTDNSKLSLDSKVSPRQSVTMATTISNETDVLSCRLRIANESHDESPDKKLLEIKPVVDNSNQFDSAKQTESKRSSKEFKSLTLPTYITSRVRKLFHLVMIAVYVPGLMWNTSALYLASVVALAVLIILEVSRFIVAPALVCHGIGVQRSVHPSSP